MSRSLEAIFAELGLTQYLGAFINQGFDSWDIILDIQESDLDVLGVKLGHRRKLQRRIANARGIAPSVSLGTPLKLNFEDAKPDGLRSEHARSDTHSETHGVSKRKYRRHPKPDENAPERPPSAYVLFSNKMREDLKAQSLTFTEIAKLVGENWQNLAAAEKEVYESQANAAKEKYHRDMVEYKKTPEYRRYAHYLHEFKEKQAKQNQAHDAAKRPKLETIRPRNGSTSSGTPAHTNSSGSGTGSGSGSERLQGSEPPPTRRERINSVASVTDVSSVPRARTHELQTEDAGLSSRAAHLEVSSPRDPDHGSSRRPSAWREHGRNAESPRHNLPSLSDMLDDGKMGIPGSSNKPYGSGFVASNVWRSVPESTTGPAPGRTPLTRHEPSPNGSHGSTGSATSHGRAPGDGPLAIHALLSNRPTAVAEKSPPAAVAYLPSPDQGARPFGVAHVTRGYGFQSGSSAFQNMRVEQNGDGDVVMTTDDQGGPNRRQADGKEGYDGMSALLQAGEIVGRRQGRRGDLNETG